ncbi:MAG: IS200/IS605 family transposase [Ferruginibacter sp.]
MSWVRIWVHLVFATKNRKPFLNSKIRKQVFGHMKDNAEKKDIWLDCVDGYTDHAHCLISLKKNQTISDVVQLIKGESSFWINKNNLITNKFAWQDDYWAVSVSESQLQKVRRYIRNQEEHHDKKTFEEEIELFMNKYGWQYVSA